MKRSKLSIISFILTTLIIVSSISVSSVADGECHFDDTSSYPVSRKSDYSYVDDIVSKKIAEEHADELSCRITDYVDKAQFESQNYAFRVEQDESLNTYVFQKEDGKRVVYFMDENVKFIDDNGEVKEKNLSLTSTEKGFSPVCNDIDILLPTTIKESIQFNYGKSSIAITPSGDNYAEGKSDGKSVSYTGVFGENTILRYTPMLSGLKEDIIVTDKTAPIEFSLILKTNGAFVYSDKDGFYLATFEQSEEKIRLGTVVAYDSKGHESIGNLLVNTVTEGSEYVVTVSIDSDFLVNESTVFPVTIDPTFIVSDNTHGSNAIQDAPIFQNKSSINFGTFLYDRVGTPDNNYGVGRTVVKLSGFTTATEYTTITASQIDSVLFYAKESSGGNTQTINLHPITGVSTWTENTVTWNTIGSSFDTSVDFGTTMYNSEWSSFDITNLVKGWKTGAYTADCGFILKNSNESNNKCFDSCECSTTGIRPYVVMTYTPTISLNYSSFDIDEGSTRTITATTHPSGLSISWSTSNSTAATVSGGLVTGVAAKTIPVTITASVTVDGTPYKATCQVFVTIPDGVYYLKNQKSGYYMTVKNGKISNLTDVIQTLQYSTVNNDVYQITQLWKVKYLSDGRYSIRPMHKLNMGLDVTSSNVDIFGIGTTDTLSGVPYYAEWTIERYTNSSSGCILKNDGLSSKTAHISGGSTSAGASVVVDNYSSTTDYRWILDIVSVPPCGIIFYNSHSNEYTAPVTQFISAGKTRSLSQMSLIPAFYSGSSIDQSLYWYSSNPSIVTVNSSSGSITGVSVGNATIYGRKIVNGVYYYISYPVKVIPIYSSYNGYAGVYSNGSQSGMSASISLPWFYPYVEDSGESVWVSTSIDSNGWWVQIGVRYYSTYSNYKLYSETYQSGIYTINTHGNKYPGDTILCKVEYSADTSLWQASCNGTIYASGPLSSSSMQLQAHAEVHLQYIQMGSFSFSNIKIKNSSGSWISNTSTPHANTHYEYNGNAYYFTVSGPVD